MNAREALRWMENDTGIMSCNDPAWPIAIRALRLLAAAEDNDGTSPETDALAKLCSTQFQIAEIARSFERERNGLAARVGELESLVEQCRGLYQVTHIHAAIDTARSKP